MLNTNLSQTPFLGTAAIAGTTSFGVLLEEEVIPYHVFRGRRKSSSNQSSEDSLFNTIIVIIVSALLFISIVALFEVLRVWLSNLFISDALQNSNFTEEEIKRTLLSDEVRLDSTIAFAIIAVLIAIFAIPLLILILRRKNN